MMAQLPDPDFMESININMRVPERLSVAPGPGPRLGPQQTEGGGAGRGVPPAYTMHIPERLTYSETPDMSPRTLFKPTAGVPVGLEPCWENVCGEALREGLQSPIRRSYSDQSFGRTPPGTPTHLKLTVPRHPSSSQTSGISFHQHPEVASTSAHPPPPPSLLSPQFMLQTARQLGQQASQRLLQALNQKYRRFTNDQKLLAPGVMTPQPVSRLVEHSKTRTMMNWSPDDNDGGSAVELIILRRQVMKMSRRLAALERHSSDHRNTEVLLFSLLISACLLNAWLWIRR